MSAGGDTPLKSQPWSSGDEGGRGKVKGGGSCGGDRVGGLGIGKLVHCGMPMLSNVDEPVTNMALRQMLSQLTPDDGLIVAIKGVWSVSNVAVERGKPIMVPPLYIIEIPWALTSSYVHHCSLSTRKELESNTSVEHNINAVMRNDFVHTGIITSPSDNNTPSHSMLHWKPATMEGFA